jgi:NAD(P)-dependent dehydrogenase (short-subunit alcohol dehydrogenase family)
MAATDALAGRRVLVVGGARHIGLAVSRAISAAGGVPLIASRDPDRAARAASTLPGAAAHVLDLTDEERLAAAVEGMGSVDDVVVTAVAHHNVAVTDLDRDRVLTAFDTKVIGPLLLLKHLAPVLPADGSVTLFSGAAAWRPVPAASVMGITNGALASAAVQLACELAPVRVNAIAPGVVDSGVWDDLGDGKGAFLEEAARGTLVGRVGTLQDVVDATLWLMCAGFVTGETIHVSGGSRLR